MFILKQARKLDVYFEYEEKIMSKTTLDKSLLDVISDPDGMCHKFELGMNLAFQSRQNSGRITVSVNSNYKVIKWAIFLLKNFNIAVLKMEKLFLI